MDPIRVLMDEHRRIEQVLDALGGFAGALAASPPEARDELGRFVRFLRRYADQIHHGKEEAILFQALLAAGMPRQMGPLAVMYAEHDEGRRYVGVLDEVARGAGPLAEGERKGAANAARAFAVLLRGHIQKEDQVLYPMALQVLSAAAQAEVAERFKAFQEKDAPPSERQELEHLGAELAARWAARA